MFGKTLFRIKAVVSFGVVSEGEKGGWIEKEDNLSQSGNAWVSGNVINLIAACCFNVTAYANIVQIGCKQHKVDTWRKIFEKNKYRNEVSTDAEYTQCKLAFELCASQLELING